MGIKEDIAEILMALYHIPGQYAIGAIILWGFWEAMKNLTNWAFIFPILAIIFIVLEILSPIFAGMRIYKKIVK